MAGCLLNCMIALSLHKYIMSGYDEGPGPSRTGILIIRIAT